MSKNLDYESNILNAFVVQCNKAEDRNFTLGKRRNYQEDGTLTDQDTGQLFSLELTKITNQKVEKETAFLIKSRGVGDSYDAYGAKEAIDAIARKEKKYSDHTSRILVLDAFSSISFSWSEYWQPVIGYGKRSKFARIYAVGIDRGFIEILRIK